MLETVKYLLWTGMEMLDIQGKLSPLKCFAFLWGLLSCICYLKTVLLQCCVLCMFYC